MFFYAVFLLVCADCVFVAHIQVNGDDQLSPIEKWVFFSFGLLFILLPLIGNLVQLQQEILLWIGDIYSKHTVQAWIRSNLRILYMITILCGSAFGAVDICNSNIFHLPLFNMGLNQRQRAIFKNQRILSTVLLENIPQIILQALYLILTVKSSISPITLIAMICSIVSIISSIFDYKSSSLLIECEVITVIEMDIESQQLGNTQVRKFRRIIVHHRNAICHELGKIICIDGRLIEILMPIQTRTGAKLVFYIRNNDSSDQNVGSTIVNTIRNTIDSGSMSQAKF